MYSDFFDPPDDAAVDDKKDKNADKTHESIDYSSGDEHADVSNEEHNYEDKDDEKSDDDSAAVSDDSDDDDEQLPVKKVKRELLADEWVYCWLSVTV